MIPKNLLLHRKVDAALIGKMIVGKDTVESVYSVLHIVCGDGPKHYFFGIFSVRVYLHLGAKRNALGWNWVIYLQPFAGRPGFFL